MTTSHGSAAIVGTSSDLSGGSDAIGKPLVVTLVHGTFAPGAAWTQPGSELRAALSLLPGCTVDVFRWSGYNLHTARVRAGHRLARRCRRIDRDLKGPVHVLVGHSHGGNVIRYALDDLPCSSTIAGAITISTPHLSADRRRVEREFRWLAAILTAGVLLALRLPFAFVLGLILSYAVPFVLDGAKEYGLAIASRDDSELAVMQLLAPFGLLLEMLALIPVGRLLWRRLALLEPWLIKKQKLLWSRLALRDCKVPMLNMQIVWDEPGTWLYTLQRVAGYPRILWRRSIAVAVAAIAFVVTVGSISEVAPEEGLWWIQFWWLGTLGFAILIGTLSGLLTLVVGTTALYVVTLSLPKVLRSNIAGFGPEGLLDNWLLDVRTSSRPCACSTAETRYYAPKRSSIWALRHSVLYGDPGAIRDAVGWIARMRAALSTQARVELRDTRGY